VHNAAEGFFRFASEPVVADLDNDGDAEVIFGSWVQKGTGHTGKLHVLDHHGNPIHEVLLPPPYGSADWNGALAAPTLANIDGDADLEVVLTTSHSGFVAYDLPGTADARVLWGTGRGNYQRTGSPLHGSLQSSRVEVSPILANPGDTLRYTIRLGNAWPALDNVRVTDTLPSELSYLGDLTATSGSYDDSDGVIKWWGTVEGGDPAILTFSAAVDEQITTHQVVVNTVRMNDGVGNNLSRMATVVVNGQGLFLPLLSKY
jgi:uncharacterized repeat protein (TIGR01451 family)